MKAKIEEFEIECTTEEFLELLKKRQNVIAPIFFYDEKLQGKLIENRRFDEGKKVYYPWFNSHVGQFLVLDRHYTNIGRCHEDKFDMMLCASFDEANALCFCLNNAIKKTIFERKQTIINLPKTHILLTLH